jgi:putative chitinase
MSCVLLTLLPSLAHESGNFRYMEEIASGAAYEGRKDLGNTEKGMVPVTRSWTNSINWTCKLSKVWTCLGIDFESILNWYQFQV